MGRSNQNSKKNLKRKGSKKQKKQQQQDRFDSDGGPRVQSPYPDAHCSLIFNKEINTAESLTRAVESTIASTGKSKFTTTIITLFADGESNSLRLIKMLRPLLKFDARLLVANFAIDNISDQNPAEYWKNFDEFYAKIEKDEQGPEAVVDPAIVSQWATSVAALLQRSIGKKSEDVDYTILRPHHWQVRLAVTSNFFRPAAALVAGAGNETQQVQASRDASTLRFFAHQVNARHITACNVLLPADAALLCQLMHGSGQATPHVGEGQGAVVNQAQDVALALVFSRLLCATDIASPGPGSKAGPIAMINTLNLNPSTQQLEHHFHCTPAGCSSGMPSIEHIPQWNPFCRHCSALALGTVWKGKSSIGQGDDSDDDEYDPYSTSAKGCQELLLGFHGDAKNYVRNSMADLMNQDFVHMALLQYGQGYHTLFLILELFSEHDATRVKQQLTLGEESRRECLYFNTKSIMEAILNFKSTAVMEKMSKLLGDFLKFPPPEELSLWLTVPGEKGEGNLSHAGEEFLVGKGADPRGALQLIPHAREKAMAHWMPRNEDDRARNPIPVHELNEVWHILTGTHWVGWRLRTKMGIEWDSTEDPKCPVFAWHRFGRSETTLPDGTKVLIGGEHEDSYDPDFCIYNDVLVVPPGSTWGIPRRFRGWGDYDDDDDDKRVPFYVSQAPPQMFLYPKAAFQPTDFHATVHVPSPSGSGALPKRGCIYVVGNNGNVEDRKPGVTPVYKLNCDTWAMEQVVTTGKPPGWIYHLDKCEYDAEHHSLKCSFGKFPDTTTPWGGDEHTTIIVDASDPRLKANKNNKKKQSGSDAVDLDWEDDESKKKKKSKKVEKAKLVFCRCTGTATLDLATLRWESKVTLVENKLGNK